jgi:predicted Rossmann fold flavoprotein
LKAGKRTDARHYDIIVVGGGASGMMAALTAAERGKRVLLLEKNRRLGEKLRITGGGRCNVTNAEYDEHALLAKYGKSEQFLYSAFSQFGVKDTFAFFEERGLPLVVEEKKRAFPKTQKAADVCRVLEQALAKAGVEVRTAAPVLRIEADKGRIVGIAVKGETLIADAYVLATGGVSHPETGSTGDGFDWLRALGHTVVAPSPEIVPLATRENWSHALRGVSIASAKIHFLLNGKRAFSKEGPILFTHFGVSGPTILNSSGRVADLLQEGEVTARIDCFPQFDEGALEAHILSVFDGEKNKLFKNVFRKIAPVGTHTVLLALLPQIDPQKKVHSITKEERKAVVQLLKALPLSITGLLGLNRAVVADGGVILEEVDMKSMRSKLFSNLYLTGDLLHIRRPSGGYSLQLCWSTGFVAGAHA